MKYKTAFRLFLKGIGVFVAIQGLDQLLWALSTISYDVLFSGQSESALLYLMHHALAFGAKLLVALYLFFGGRWIVNLAIPSNRPYCPECGYELRGLPPAGACPECGVAYHLSPAESRLTGVQESR